MVSGPHPIERRWVGSDRARLAMRASRVAGCGGRVAGDRLALRLLPGPQTCSAASI